jgi:hypothetical protein
MTLPHERTRSLTWARESLELISTNEHLSDVHRLKAKTILDVYPCPHLVRAWINADASCLPSLAAEAIEVAGELLRELWCIDSCPVELRERLRYVLRHYPGHGQARRWARPVGHGPITGWLLNEDGDG